MGIAGNHTHTLAHTQSGQLIASIAGFPRETGHFYISTFVYTAHYCFFYLCPMETFPGARIQVDHIHAMTSTTLSTVDLSRKDKVQM